MSAPPPYWSPTFNTDNFLTSNFVTYEYLAQNYPDGCAGRCWPRHETQSVRGRAMSGDITSHNLIIPRSDDAYSLGSSGQRYQSIFSYLADFKTPLATTSGGTNVGAAGTAGNVLTSDGTNWTSAPAVSSPWNAAFTEPGTWDKVSGNVWTESKWTTATSSVSGGVLTVNSAAAP